MVRINLISTSSINQKINLIFASVVNQKKHKAIQEHFIELMNTLYYVLTCHPNGIPDLCLIDAFSQHKFVTEKELSLVLNYAIRKKIVVPIQYFPKVHPSSQWKFFLAKQIQSPAENN